MKETQIQERERVDKSFQELKMTGSHTDYQIAFEEVLEDMNDADMDIPSEETLYRKYLTKLTVNLRSAIQGRLWLLDGEDMPSRKPKTWREVADC